MHWSFIKVQLSFHVPTDKWTDIQMHNYIHSMVPTSLSKYTRLESCTIALSMASTI